MSTYGRPPCTNLLQPKSELLLSLPTVVVLLYVSAVVAESAYFDRKSGNHVSTSMGKKVTIILEVFHYFAIGPLLFPCFAISHNGRFARQSSPTRHHLCRTDIMITSHSRNSSQNCDSTMRHHLTH